MAPRDYTTSNCISSLHTVFMGLIITFDGELILEVNKKPYLGIQSNSWKSKVIKMFANPHEYTVEHGKVHNTLSVWRNNNILCDVHAS